MDRDSRSTEPHGSEPTVRLAPLDVSPAASFLLRAGMLVPDEYIPLHSEWCEGANRFASMEEAWTACCNPELLLFMDYSSPGLEERVESRIEALRIFIEECSWAGGLHSDGILPFAERVVYSEVFGEAWAPDSRTHWAVARRAAVQSRRARTRAGEDPARVQADQAERLKELLGHPFEGFVHDSDGMWYRVVGESGGV